MPGGMAMRFVSFRWLRSLAAQLLCTYVAALILTTCCIACAIWFGLNQHAGATTQAQLRRVADLLHHGLRFDSAGRPEVIGPLPFTLSWVYRDFATDLKYRVLDASGVVVLSSEEDQA